MPSPPIKPRPPAAALPPEFRPWAGLLALSLALLMTLGVVCATPAVAQTASAAPLALTPADTRLIGQAQDYLNRQTGLTANFLQVAADGSTRTGKAWLERPGKMRFEYDPPDKQLLVAGFGLLVYNDPALAQTTNIPLGATPLGILLASHVDLNGGNVTVTAITRQPGEDDITLVRKDKPAAGSLTLVFSTDPLELHQWVVRDAQGQETRVSLYDITPGGPYPDALFQYNPGTSPVQSGG